MKAIYFNKEPALVEDYPKPRFRNDEALVKVILAGICATDKEIIKGYQNYKGVMGHEFVGIVEDCEDSSLIGKRVVGGINIGCGECEFCYLGMPNHCNNRRTLGIHNKDGAFAEYLTLPIENLVIVPDNVSDRNAVFAEPLAAAIHALDELNISLNHKVAIIGDGKLGLLVVNALITTGCEIFLFGNHPDRKKIFKGFCNYYNSGDSVNFENSFDIVIDCSGVPETLLISAKILKPKGTIILKSTYAQGVMLDPSLWVRKEIKIYGSRCGNIQAAVNFLSNDRIDLTGLIDAVYRIDEWEKAFSHAFTRGSLKIILEF